ARRFGTEEDLWTLAERLLPHKDIETYTQALMDLGATVCTRVPKCEACPVRQPCVARKTGRIAELPAPRVRKVLPLRTTRWFVYLDRGKVLLERRPSPGIWGGLWCFPERALAKAATTRKLEPFEHGFTHFRLRIEPLLIVAAPKSGGFWLDVDEARAAAIPTPVKKLLQDLPRIATSRGGGRR
ncbi:MAG TPA: NUDIX domain-containing protein, partial [Burkholderiales bacterium]